MKPLVRIYCRQNRYYEVYLNHEAIAMLNTKELIFDKENLIIRIPIFSDNKTFEIYKDKWGGRFTFTDSQLNESDILGYYDIEKEDDDYILTKQLSVNRNPEHKPSINIHATRHPSYHARINMSAWKLLDSNEVTIDIPHIKDFVFSNKSFTIKRSNNKERAPYGYFYINYKGDESKISGSYSVVQNGNICTLIKKAKKK